MMDPAELASIYFPIQFTDPKERVQAYLDAYKEQEPKGDVRICVPSYPGSLTDHSSLLTQL